MSKYANPGELRTPVRFTGMERSIDSEGNAQEREVNVFGEGKVVMCKWVNAHGTEVFDSLKLSLREPATVTMRYSPLIKTTLLIYKGDDKRPYEVISIDDVEDRHVWLELKVQRKGAAR